MEEFCLKKDDTLGMVILGVLHPGLYQGTWAEKIGGWPAGLCLCD